LRHRKRR